MKFAVHAFQTMADKVYVACFSQNSNCKYKKVRGVVIKSDFH